MRLLLIRHGQSSGNAAGRMQGWSDEPLTELGAAQAEALACRLQREHRVSTIYSSPLLRARKTAEIVATSLGLPVQLDERLKEMSIGAITGLTYSEVEERYPQVAASWRTELDWASVPGQEDRTAFLGRVMSFFTDVAARHAGDGEIAIVAHGGSLTALMAGLTRLDYGQRQPWSFGNASLSIVEVGGLRPRILLLNDRHHCHKLGG
jgi:broad specificity phosphatase PhoE